MDRSLISLSMVTVLWETRRNYFLDIFTSFVATLSNRRSITAITVDQVPEFCKCFVDEFGIIIPFHPMLAIINKCRQNGVLRKEMGRYVFVKDAVSKSDFSAEEALLIRKQKSLVVGLSEFAHTEYEQDIDPALAEDLLIDLLRHNDIDILFASRDTTSVLPEIRIAKKYKGFLHILNRYIIHIYNSNPAAFSYLSDVSLGHVITAAVVVQVYDWPGDTVRKSMFYLDTPIIFKLLGADGPEQAREYEDFMMRLRKGGADLAVFQHTMAEVNEILEGSVKWANRPDFDPARASRVALFFRQQGYSQTEIEKFILRVESILGTYEIKIREVPAYDENGQHVISEGKLQSLIESSYLEGDPSFDKELHEFRTRRDVSSISAIYRLRRDSRPRFLRES